MAQYIDKDALVAEIERLREQDYLCDTFEESTGYYNAIDEIDTFLNTLEVKEVDLEEAIDDYIYTHDGRKRLALEPDWKYCNLTLKGGDETIKFAKHFFELGLKAQKGEMLQNALDIIIELVEGDPSTFCEVVDEHYPNWCENNCENFNHDCLMKYLKHYKKGE